MRQLIMWALSLCLLTSARAATYYFSASGNDSYSSTQAKSSATPWKSINKLNAIFSTLQPGDVILFKRGETFYGTIKVTKSGTTTAPITFGAYGSGNKPLITGFVTLTNWVSVGSGKYESHNVSLGSAVNVVSFNDKNQEMGRYPNSNTANGGYLTFESHGTNYIKDNELTGATNWTGAEVVVRTVRFVLDRVKITSHSSSTISYSPALTYTPSVVQDGFGYFIQNDIRTLDQLGEWYYNPSTKKMTVYFGSSSPSAYPVKASTLNRLVDIYDKDNIIVDNLAFSGGNENTIYIDSANNVQIKNCDISFSNEHAILTKNTQNFLAQNNTINHTQNTAILIHIGSYALIKGNRISNTGLLPGMGMNSTDRSLGIRESNSWTEFSNNTVIEYNTIENTGYTGIRFIGNNALIKNNFVSRYTLIKDDGGGIYTKNLAGVVTTGQKIIGNIVVDGIGAAGGTNTTVAYYTNGIYLDDHATNVEVAGNTVARNANRGVLLHNNTGTNVHDNTLYDNYTQLQLIHDKNAADKPMRNLTIKNNILVARTPAQWLLFVQALGNDISSMGTFDNNTFSRPLDKEGYFIQTYTNTATGTVVKVHDLKSWQTAYGRDLNSRVSAAYVQPHKLNALLGSNRFPNGGFDANISGLNAYSSASHTKSWVASKLDKGTFQGALTSSTPSLYIINTPIGAVTAGKKYAVKFTAQSSRDTTMNVYFRKSGAPYTTLSNDGMKNMVKITTGRREYELVYTPKASESSTSLFLEVNARSQSFWLDNLKVHEADAVVTNPDDSIKLVYNETASSKTVALNGTYVDALGKSYSSSITLAPYAGAVLIKTSTSTSTPPAVSLTSPTANATYTAPASVRLTATASDADGTISKVEFYRGSTLITTEFTAPYDWTWSNVAAGTYTITAKAYDNSGNVTTSAPANITVKAASVALAAVESNEVMMGEETSSSAGFKLYPNPAVDKIFVAFDASMSNNERANMTIRNTAGSVVKSMPVTLSGNDIEVDITSLIPGTYVLNITSYSFNKSQKFLKEE